MIKIIVSSKNPKPLQFSTDFLAGMANRMVQSFFKYGNYEDAYPSKLNALESGLIRIGLYLGPARFFELLENVRQKFLDARVKQVQHGHGPGNTEYLIDAGNFCMIEFMRPSIPDAHFEATDTDGSPGRVWNTGRVDDSSNTIGQENLRRGGSHMRTDGGFYQREGD